MGRFLTGPLRVSPFFADLDPTTAGGRVFSRAESDQFTRTWCNVRDFDGTGRHRGVAKAHGRFQFGRSQRWERPDDPTERFLGANNVLSLMGQEIGHRWLAYTTFRDQNGVTSKALLGRDEARWSFFFDSEAWVMEGNDIERRVDSGCDRGDGPRVPSAAGSAKVNRQAFIFVVSSGRTLDLLHVTKIDRIRLAWAQFFDEATNGRMQAETRLRVGS